MLQNHAVTVAVCSLSKNAANDKQSVLRPVLPLAVNVTLPTFAAERRLQAYQLSTDSLQTRAPDNKPAAVDRWHRQTDGHPTIT